MTALLVPKTQAAKIAEPIGWLPSSWGLCCNWWRGGYS